MQMHRAVMQAQREQRSAMQTQAAAARLAASQARASAAQQAAWTKQQEQLYHEAQEKEVKRLNGELQSHITALESLLRTSLARDPFVDLVEMKQTFVAADFNAGALGLPLTPPDPGKFQPHPPSWFANLLPGAKAKAERAKEAGRLAYEGAYEDWARSDRERQTNLEERRSEHQAAEAARQATVEEQNRDVDDLQTRLGQGDADAIVEYFTMVLDRSPYPDGFPSAKRVGLIPESRQLVVEAELPSMDDVVPQEKAFRYVKTRRAVESSPMPTAQRRSLYRGVVSQATLRIVNEVFAADRAGLLESLVANCVVDTIDRSTGQPARPCLATLRITRDTLQDLDLGQVDPERCLRGLNALLSRSPEELVPVRPVIEFNMVDPRFIEEADVLSTLDDRQNLLALTFTDFETLIANLFAKMGLEMRQTRPSRDGGVDCVAFDSRAILGGKIVIQAKRYKNTVGVSAVRDLFGTVHNEGASKGILVTTSGYGQAAYEFAEGKPLELISGSQLLWLLREHAGVDAKIEVPDGWEAPAEEHAKALGEA
jgi:restriction system protein